MHKLNPLNVKVLLENLEETHGEFFLQLSFLHKYMDAYLAYNWHACDECKLASSVGHSSLSSDREFWKDKNNIGYV